MKCGKDRKLSDERAVAVKREDAETLKRMGTTVRKIVDRMKTLRGIAVRGLGNRVAVDGGIEVEIDSARGLVACPFCDAGTLEKTNTIVRRGKEEVMFSDLNIHMIEQHGFFEMPGSPFRVDPERLVRVLGAK